MGEGSENVDVTADAAVLARFAGAKSEAGGDVAQGSVARDLLAYALHRQARIDFRREFAGRHQRAPTEAEEAVFLIGDLTETRVSAYRVAASAMIVAASAEKGAPVPQAVSPKRRQRWPWFGMWVESPIAPSDAGPVNWRGFAFRLLVLLLAVVATALLLRVLIVKA